MSDRCNIEQRHASYSHQPGCSRRKRVHIVGIVCAGALFLASCSDEASDDIQYLTEELDVSEDEARELLEEYGDPDDAIGEYDDVAQEPFDEERAAAAAEEDLAAEGYDLRYGCTADCSGHEAGWQWRAEQGYATPGYSDSFDEGGRAFDEAIEERVDHMRQRFDEGDY